MRAALVNAVAGALAGASNDGRYGTQNDEGRAGEADCATRIDGYRTIERLASAMADAAAGGDWARFANAQRDVERAIATLPSLDSDADAALRPSERRARFALLARILAHDARVRDAIEPSSPSLEVWLGRRPFSAIDRGHR